MLRTAYLAAAALAAIPAQAQEGDGPIVLGPITVTGERIERTVAETPSSVVVVTGEELDNTPARNTVEEVLERIPNITSTGASGNAPTIRGVDSTGVLQGADAFLGGARPRSTVTLDGRPLNANEFVYGATSVFDLERIEVFRGPQTTAQGVNSIAGAIYVTTADPTFEPEAKARALVGSYQQHQLAGAVSGPIVADELGARLAVDVRKATSPVDFDTTEGYGADPNDIDQETVRAKLLWAPSALPALSTKLTLSRNASEAAQVAFVRPPLSKLRSSNEDQSVFRTIATGAIHDLSYAFGDNLTVANRFSATNLDVTRLAREGDGDATIDGEEYINETTLNFSGFRDRLEGLLGTYLQRTDNDEFVDLSDFLGVGEFEDRRTSLGAFGEATYDITERFDVTLGLRYQRDNQDREGGLGPFGVDYDETFDAFLPKLALGYDVTDDVRVGAIASRGFNPGGTTISFETGNQDTFEEETVWNYELFLRSRFLNDRLGFDANLFFADFTDYQRATFTGFAPTGEPEFEIDNADKAKSYGLELEAEFLATEKLRLSGGLGLLKTEVEKFSASVDEDAEGREFARAPNVTAIAGVEYEALPGLSLGAQVRYSDGYFSDEDNTEELEVEQFLVADVRMSYRRAGVELFAFVDNVFDHLYELETFDDSTVVGQPREFGVGIALRF